MSPYRSPGLLPVLEEPRPRTRWWCPIQGWGAYGEGPCCPRRCGPAGYLEAWPRHLLRWLVG